MNMLDPSDELDHIAEFADSGVRIFQRQGSLVGVPGSYGLKRYLYSRWRNNGNAIYTFLGSLLAIGLSGTWLISSNSRCCSPASARPRF